MAGSIQGLTVVINGDATPLTKAMRQAKGEATTLRTHMTALNKLIKFDPSSMALITRQQQLMNAQLTQAAARMAMLKEAEREFYASVGPHSEAEIRQFQRLQREITECELQMAMLREQAIQMGLGASASTLQWAGRLEKMSTTLGKVSTQALAVSAAVGLIGAMAIKSAYDFEQSFAGVRKTIIATDEEYAKLARSTRDIALVKPIDVNDVNEIMMYAGQLGIANEYLTKFASTMADLDVATDMDLEEGSMQLARFTNIVGMSQGDVDRLGATIVDLGNNSATTESQIMLMSMRIAGAGANLGMTASDVLGLGATLSSLGIQAEMGGNAIATIMNRIDKDVALNKSTLSTWAATAGMSAEEFKAAWTNDVTGTLLKVISGMGTFRDEGNNLNVLLKDMGISYMRQIDTMQRLSRAGDLATSLIGRANTAWENNTALVREATQRYDTAASKTQMMKNAFNEVGIVIGNEILPTFKDVVLTITDALHAFANMSDGTKTLIVNTMAFVTAGGLAIKGLEMLTGAGAGVIRTFASIKTALGLASMGELTYSNMTIATTAAMTGNTAALEANGLAKVQNMTLTAALSGAMDQLALNCLLAADAVGIETTALMDLSSLAIIGLTAGTVALAAGVTALTVAAINAYNPVNQLTMASKEQADAIRAHEEEYNELVSTEGEHSEAAIRAKAALDEEKSAFENTSLTLGEFCENMQAARDDTEEMSRKLHESLVDAENSAGSMLNLADSIQSLSATALDNSDDMEEMLAEINALNQLVPDLNLSFNTTTGELEAQSSAWRALVDEAARTKIAEQALSNYNDALSEQATHQKNLDAAISEYNSTAREYYELAEAGVIAYSDIPVAAQMAAGALEDAQKAMDSNKSKMSEATEVMREYTSRENALKYSIQELATYTGDAADENARAAEIAERASEMFGIEVTAADVLAAREADLAKRTEEVTQNTQELAEELQTLMVNNSAFSDAILDSGMSLNDFAKMMSEAGISADDLAKAIDETADKVSDGFNRIADESEISLQEYMDNLQHNIEVTENWGSNLDTLYSNAAEGYEQDFVRYVANLGPEYAGFVQQLVDDSDGFKEAAKTWQQAMQTGTNATLSAEGLTLSSFGRTKNGSVSSAQQMGSSVTSIYNTLSNAATTAFERMRGNVTGNMYSTASGVASGAANLAQGLNSMVGRVFGISNEYSSAISSIDRHSGSMYGWGRSTGLNYAEGLTSAEARIFRAAWDIADGIKSIFGHSVPKEGPLHNHGKGEAGWGEESVQNYIDGMSSKEGALREVATSLSSVASGAFTSTGGADWNAATRSTVDPYASQSPMMVEWQMALESTVTQWLDEKLGPTIAKWTPVPSTRDFARMVSEVSNG